MLLRLAGRRLCQNEYMEVTQIHVFKRLIGCSISKAFALRFLENLDNMFRWNKKIATNYEFMNNLPDHMFVLHPDI